MPKIEYPIQLTALLEDSEYQAPLRALADRAGEIFADNKLPFFPDYTGHGLDHIICVLKTEVDLVPDEVWEKSKPGSHRPPLSHADAVVIIGATILHDIAMHVRPAGLFELVSKNSRFKPLPWFDGNQEGHSADRPWFDLWQDYLREASRFNDRTLINIIGPKSVREGWRFEDLPKETAKWADQNYCLIIGEFIRRHHARLAHEIAIYGFPGLPVGSGEGQFPALGREKANPLHRLADLIGLSARSHGTSLRVCEAYLDDSPDYTDTPQPMGTAVLYPMALLRVADYFQIDRQRAPAILLQLRNPPSTVSVQEWEKHKAVQSITSSKDPRAKLVTISTKDVKLEVYLQLRELLNNLQMEMDNSTAVLDEAYGNRSDYNLDVLRLATRRVKSNLHQPHFADNLPFLLERIGFSSDPKLLALLVEPLYSNAPSVGVRELMQNAVDAVCELKAWCKRHKKEQASLDLPEQDSDVLIEFEKGNGTWLLRVRDRGIGMTWETIHNYFLRAGASFRESPEWAKEFLDETGQPTVLRAGRFGIGAFALFLLGPKFNLCTRHVSGDKLMGYAIEVSSDSDLIEIRRITNLPVGTTVEIELSEDSIDRINLHEKTYRKLNESTDWFTWDWPKVSRRVVRGRKIKELVQKYVCPIRKSKLPPEWSIIHQKGFPGVFWSFEDLPRLVCNGIKIAQPEDGDISWDEDEVDYISDTELIRPSIAVLDSEANLPLTIQRNRLSRELPFIHELTKDVIYSFIAHALVCGPNSPKMAHSGSKTCGRHPLAPIYPPYQFSRDSKPFSQGSLRWACTSRTFVPADPWLYSLLQRNHCLVYGILLHKGFQEDYHFSFYDYYKPPRIDQVILRWDEFSPFVEDWQNLSELRIKGLSDLAQSGIEALGHKILGAQVIASFRDRKDGSVFKPKGINKTLKWREITHASPQWRHYKLQTGAMSASFDLNDVLFKMEQCQNVLQSTDSHNLVYSEPNCFYIAEIRTKPKSCRPESLLAKIWNECLGPSAIPFHPAARRALIGHGRKHPELKRHIEAWEEMKRTGSKWVTGGK